MKISIATLVDQDFLSVKKAFNAHLLKTLSPPFPKVTIKRFDGISTSDEVSMELDFIFFKQTWDGEIIDHRQTDQEFYFVDIGTKLPFFLKSWQHKHRLINKGNQTLIVDEINYRSINRVMTLLFYPVMIGQFLYRKPIYKKFFAKKNKSALSQV
jgi:ligand-binding SRPBCC domain-containing protein